MVAVVCLFMLKLSGLARLLTHPHLTHEKSILSEENKSLHSVISEPKPLKLLISSWILPGQKCTCTRERAVVISWIFALA